MATLHQFLAATYVDGRGKTRRYSQSAIARIAGVSESTIREALHPERRGRGTGLAQLVTVNERLEASGYSPGDIPPAEREQSRQRTKIPILDVSPEHDPIKRAGVMVGSPDASRPVTAKEVLAVVTKAQLTFGANYDTEWIVAIYGLRLPGDIEAFDTYGTLEAGPNDDITYKRGWYSRRLPSTDPVELVGSADRWYKREQAAANDEPENIARETRREARDGYSAYWATQVQAGRDYGPTWHRVYAIKISRVKRYE